MKDIKINVSRETRMVDLSKTIIGNEKENLQGKFIFSFVDEFVDGQGRLEYITNGEKQYAILEKVEESYQTPILSVMTKEGQIDMQLVITEGIEEEVPVFKSNIFYVRCNASINAEIEQPEEYPQWIEIANTKLNEVDNLDIDAIKIDGVATITITKKDGTQESVEIYDGDAGSGGGTNNYEDLNNKPMINGVELIGNKSLEDIGAFSGSYNDLKDTPTIPTSNSQLDNDSNFVNKEYVDTAIESAIGLALEGSY